MQHPWEPCGQPASLPAPQGSPFPGNHGFSHRPWRPPPFQGPRRQPDLSLPPAKSWPSRSSNNSLLILLPLGKGCAELVGTAGASSGAPRHFAAAWHSEAGGLFSPAEHTSQNRKKKNNKHKKTLCSRKQGLLKLSRALAKSFTAAREQRRCVS